MIKKELRSKFKIYAIFQGLSLLAMGCLFAAFALLVYQEDHIDGKTIAETPYWQAAISNSLSFYESSRLDAFLASFLTYLTLILWMVTWITGLLVVKAKNRNLFDSLFLLFVMLPVISNLFAIMAQMTLKTKDYTSSTIDKAAIKLETEKILKESEAANKK